MKRIPALSIFILCICCTYHPKEKRLSEYADSDYQIIESYYRIKNDTIEFKRILKGNSDIALQIGAISFGEFGLTNQEINQVLEFSNETRIVDSLAHHFKDEGFVQKTSDEREVMFIQIIPDSNMGYLEFSGFMNLRHKVGGDIDDVLAARNLGEWFAGDMGAGANILFFIDNWNDAMKEVIKILEREDLLGHVLVTKRIVISPDDWNYEIVFPLEYEGIFNQM